MRFVWSIEKECVCLSDKTIIMFNENKLFELPDNGLLNSLTDLMATHWQELAKKKEEILIQKLKEKGFDHLLEGIETRRFKRITCETSPTEETFFADDGTDEGCRIVTFLKPEINFPIRDRGNFIDTSIKYY